MSTTLSPVPTLSPPRDRHENHKEGYFTDGLGNFLTSGLNSKEMYDFQNHGKKKVVSPNVEDHIYHLFDREKVLQETHPNPDNGHYHPSYPYVNNNINPPTSPNKETYTLTYPYVPKKDTSPSTLHTGKAFSPNKKRGGLESVGGLSNWEMTNDPIHFQHQPHDHYTGPIENTKGGIFGYLAELQKLALANPSNQPNPGADRKSVQLQHGELSNTGLGNYMGDETSDHPSDIPQYHPSRKLRSFGEGNTAVSSLYTNNSATSPSKPGNGTFDAYSVGNGLYQYISDKGDAPRPRIRTPSELEKLGIKHPGAVGIHEPDPKTTKHHIRFFSSNRGVLAEEGGLGPHIYTSDPNSHRNFSSVDGTTTQSIMEDPVFHKSQLSTRSGGIGGYNVDQEHVSDPPNEEYLPLFPGDKFPKRRPNAVFDNRDYFQSDAVKEILKEEEAEETIARQLAELDTQLARAGLASTRRAPIGEAGPLHIATSVARQNDATSPKSHRRHQLSNRWHEERNHAHIKFGASSPAAALVASSGRVPLDGARLARARAALRATLPKDNQAALLMLKRRLSARDGDMDGVLTDEELLRTLIDLSPSNISASDVGHMARYLREHGRILRSNAQAVADASGDDQGQAVRRAHHTNVRIGGESGYRYNDENDLDDYEEQEEGYGSKLYNDNDSVEILPSNTEKYFTKRDRRIQKANAQTDKHIHDIEENFEEDGVHEEGVLVDAMANWLLGLEGVGKNNASPQRTGNMVGILAQPSENTNEKSSSTKKENKEDKDTDESRLDFASKDMAYTTFRVAWEAKHGAPAKKEAMLDAKEGSEGPTWTKASPKPFRVLHLASSPPTAQAVVNEARHNELSLLRV